MDCPDCGGPMWDNRDNKRNPKQPDFKCKDKDGCGKGVWVKGKGGGSGNGNRGQGAANAAGPRNSRPLVPLYGECLGYAVRAVKHHLPTATTADILAGAATLFIAATRDGAPLVAPKPKPAPPPPPKEPEPEFEGNGGYDGDGSELPF